MKRESELQREIMDALKHFSCLKAWRCNSGTVKVRGGFMHLAPAGTPDVIGFFRESGRFFGIECKSSHKEKCNCVKCIAQRAWKADAGPNVLIVDNVRSLDDAIRGLGLEGARIIAGLVG